MTVSVDAGEPTRDGTIIVDVENDGTGSKGDVVNVSSGQTSQASGNGTGIFGVLNEASGSAGDRKATVIHGPVAVVAGGSVTEGNLLQVDSTAGRVVDSAANEGIVTAVDEGDTDTYDIYTRYLVALEDASDGDVFEAYLG